MQLSIIIVNYNVRNFIDLCLLSVKEALKDIDAEVFVVDNNSVDDSVEYLKKNHNWVHLIENKHNPGFSVANNQAFEKAKGKYVLLLNPDTIVEENTFIDCIHFMDKTPKAGALGVKMIGGDGSFQVESKRGLPTPMVSFYKMLGLSKVFPNSKRFARYNLSYLPENKINEIDVLSGAFMFMRKSVLDEIGMLDERFFMYGEDIDLSYRILKSGFKNYYFPKTKILHFKGESTKKENTKYIFIFYNAMILFAEKHFASRKTILFITFIKFAVYFRIAISIIKLFILKLFLRRGRELSSENQHVLIIANENEQALIKLQIEKEFNMRKIVLFSLDKENRLNYLQAIIKRVNENTITEIVFSNSLKNSLLLDFMYSLTNKAIKFKLINIKTKIILGSRK